MLVLSRKPEEAIRIGGDIRIVVIRLGPNSVRFGIEAPEHLNIVREELLHDGQSHCEELGEPERAADRAGAGIAH